MTEKSAEIAETCAVSAPVAGSATRFRVVIDDVHVERAVDLAVADAAAVDDARIGAVTARGDQCGQDERGRAHGLLIILG